MHVRDERALLRRHQLPDLALPVLWIEREQSQQIGPARQHPQRLPVDDAQPLASVVLKSSDAHRSSPEATRSTL